MLSLSDDFVIACCKITPVILSSFLYWRVIIYIKLQFVVSKPTESWHGRVGHVQDNFDGIDTQNSAFFLCGLPAMVEAAEAKLLDIGVAKEDIKHERF